MVKEKQAEVPKQGQISEYIAEDIGMKAYYALLEEVYTTPKPGLVDLYSCGAHTDMDVHTFEKSAEALKPWFIRMAAQGYLLTCTREELFIQIRKTGIMAEKAMFQATDGVNTHKGMIFTLGIFCAAAGRCMKDYGEINLRTLIRVEQEMTSRVLKNELSALSFNTGECSTNGEKNLRQYGTAGIRGEALAGYPSVTEIALPVLADGIYKKKEWNKVKIQILFALMSRVQDSNILSRKNPKVLYEVQTQAMNFLNEGGAYSEHAMEKLLLMDAEYIRKNISAGGCADLLATCIFLAMICKKIP